MKKKALSLADGAFCFMNLTVLITVSAGTQTSRRTRPRIMSTKTNLH